ncbi:hypothetical protein PanWU01x14_155370 [Parasponia andersonii]|uniref:Uncharacterized protein n=1 Tax=Parasponia andersonii TaxID=3476 RepID=A0A2P5CG48_PARAD|nr:hypothetical protein PanWU01x14_155370 [Parasponia andersonii]
MQAQPIMPAAAALSNHIIVVRGQCSTVDKRISKVVKKILRKSKAVDKCISQSDAGPNSGLDWLMGCHLLCCIAGPNSVAYNGFFCAVWQ